MARACGLVVITLTTLLAGCGLETFPAEADSNATLRDIDRIRNDVDLLPEEKRIGLEELGLSPTSINALLQDERLANQFGGDLRSAYDKVIDNGLARLTPDEIQFYGDAVRAINSTLSSQFDDDQARGIATLFSDNRIDNPQELQIFLSDEANLSSLPAGVTAETLTGVFIDIDPSQVLPLI